MATKAEDPPVPAPSAAAAAAAASDTDPAACDSPAAAAAAELFDKRKEKDDDHEEEEESELRETKRRRTTRQLSLEKLPPNSSSSGWSGRENGPGLQGLSFSFDTRISAPIDTTPKFGSFNLSLDLAGLENNCGDDGLGLAREAEDEDRNETAEGGHKE